MTRFIAMILTGLLATIGLLGLAPTAAAQEACVPVLPDGEFEYGVCADATSSECAVWTYSRFNDACYVAPAGAVCVPVIPDGEFQRGVCADVTSSQCSLWTYDRFGQVCYAQ